MQVAMNHGQLHHTHTHTAKAGQFVTALTFWYKKKTYKQLQMKQAPKRQHLNFCRKSNLLYEVNPSKQFCFALVFSKSIVPPMAKDTGWSHGLCWFYVFWGALWWLSSVTNCCDPSEWANRSQHQTSMKNNCGIVIQTNIRRSLHIQLGCQICTDTRAVAVYVVFYNELLKVPTCYLIG